jgi:DNA-directed RNA polymerase subunit RPC12/RpoP
MAELTIKINKIIYLCDSCGKEVQAIGPSAIEGKNNKLHVCPNPECHRLYLFETEYPIYRMVA